MTTDINKIPTPLKQKSASDISADIKKEPESKPKLEKVNVPEKPSINKYTGIKFFDLVIAWIYWNLISETSSSIKGEGIMQPKAWYMSKTLWINLIGIIYLFIRGPFGLSEVISDEILVGVLAAINFLLRIITKKPVEW